MHACRCCLCVTCAQTTASISPRWGTRSFRLRGPRRTKGSMPRTGRKFRSGTRVYSRGVGWTRLLGHHRHGSSHALLVLPLCWFFLNRPRQTWTTGGSCRFAGVWFEFVGGFGPTTVGCVHCLYACVHCVHCQHDRGFGPRPPCPFPCFPWPCQHSTTTQCSGWKYFHFRRF